MRAEDLPGEASPLDWHPGRRPITDDEALGTARRRTAILNEQKGLYGAELPDELPPEKTRRTIVFRLPEATLMRAHARAEMETVPLTSIIAEALTAYAEGRPENPRDVRARVLAAGLRVKSPLAFHERRRNGKPVEDSPT